ncbi:glycosyltransferase family 2 protein [Candidatus Saccharibacteria bacterium]|nr:glycosyltransferase family 2 protein [Candidatus Saccharibacteria bacterium]MBH1973247.1 glycosyltransferase family 2 protein [Candidatus Saccharibacteria bacterium]MBH1990512.1 glycosyltransferase family 2 protein [Candidatus Saccharibacteria bacterium]
MYRNKKISVCLPCRNEANHLHEVIKRVPKIVDEIIVISNNSYDDTVEVAKKLKLIALEDNRTIGGIGYGFAHMTGIQHATGDIIVGADGDATYPIEDLKIIIDRLLDEQLDFISCNRYPLQEGTKIPFKLRLGVGTLNWEARLLYGVKINDILSGMWVFNKTAKKHLNLTMGEWNLSPQIKLNAALHPKINFSEHSIAQHQRMGDSHQAHFKTGFQHLWWIFLNRFFSAEHLEKKPDA